MESRDTKELVESTIPKGEQCGLRTRIATTEGGSRPQLPKRRKQRLWKRIYETTKTLAAQFAPQCLLSFHSGKAKSAIPSSMNVDPVSGMGEVGVRP